jgi:hypothetical protein
LTTALRLAANHRCRLFRLRAKQQLPQTSDRRALLVDQLRYVQIRCERGTKRLEIVGSQLLRLQTAQQRLHLPGVQFENFGLAVPGHQGTM